MIATFKNLFLSPKDKDAKLYQQLKEDLLFDDKLISVHSAMTYAAKKYAARTALIFNNEKITYQELFQQVLYLSNKLSSQNIGKGDRVQIYIGNSLEFFIAYFAVLHLGAIAVPLNLFLHDSEIRKIIADSSPSAILIHQKNEVKIQGIVAQLADSLKSNPAVIVVRHEVIAEPLPEPSLSDIISQAPSIEELSLLLYTSGTSGSPKGVMLSSKNIISNALQGASRFGSAVDNISSTSFFCVIPLFHAFAQMTCIWIPILLGNTIIIVEKIDRQAIRQGLKHKPDIFLGFPALFGLLCLMKNASLDSVKLFISGADMLTDRIRGAFAMLYGRKIFSGYGLTEASPLIALNSSLTETPTNVVGRPLFGITIEIRKNDTTLAQPGDIGVLWVKGDNIMLGYYKSPEQTNYVLQNGWLCTGDLALIRSDESIAICGRNKDLIIHKGFNIYPSEIENILMKHPTVYKAAVIGVPDQNAGEIPVAYIATKNPNLRLQTILRSLCKGNLANYKIPRQFICLDDLPMNATGKIDKKQLKEAIANQSSEETP